MSACLQASTTLPRAHRPCCAHCAQVYHLKEPPEDIQQQYADFDGVPDCLIKNAIYARSARESEELCKAYLGQRQGYATDMDKQTAEGELPCLRFAFLMCTLTLEAWLRYERGLCPSLQKWPPTPRPVPLAPLQQRWAPLHRPVVSSLCLWLHLSLTLSCVQASHIALLWLPTLSALESDMSLPAVPAKVVLTLTASTT